jgi:uncharacterized protein (DUF1330 family)
MTDELGYLLVRARIHDRPKFGAYVRALPSVYQQYGGRYLCLSPQATLLLPSGTTPSAPTALVISVWASLARLQEFWFSTEYQTVAALRAGTGEFQVGALVGRSVGRSDAHMGGDQIALCVDDDSQDLDLPPAAIVLAQGQMLNLEGEGAGLAAVVCSSSLPTQRPRSGAWYFGARLSS